ncbi:MAG TPA: HAD family hydrolase [Phycisphaerae bacterium]
MIRAVIFDLDDTLYPERAYAMSGFAAVAEAFAQTLATPAEELRGVMCRLFDTQHRGRVFNEVIQQVCSRASVQPGTEELVAAMMHAYYTHRPKIELFPDADRALQRLHGTVKLGIISDGLVAVQNAKIDALGVRARVDQIIITDEWGRDFWKPHVRAFEEMSARLGVPHAQCMYVADNVTKDFIAPRKLGWQTVMVRRIDAVYGDRTAPESGAAEVTIDNLDALSTQVAA